MFLLILINIHLVSSQLETEKIKPDRCYGEDRVLDRQCCIFPPFFKRDIARSCGAMFVLVDLVKDYNVTNLRREYSQNNCKFWKCVLNKYDMLDKDDHLILENYFAHLDRWLSLNTGFNPVLIMARNYCRDMQRLFFPLTTCEFFTFQMCIRGYVNVHCPEYIQSKECLEWKDFYNDCKEYYI